MCGGKQNKNNGGKKKPPRNCPWANRKGGEVLALKRAVEWLPLVAWGAVISETGKGKLQMPSDETYITLRRERAGENWGERQED